MKIDESQTKWITPQIQGVKAYFFFYMPEKKIMNSQNTTILLKLFSVTAECTRVS